MKSRKLFLVTLSELNRFRRTLVDYRIYDDWKLCKRQYIEHTKKLCLTNTTPLVLSVFVPMMNTDSPIELELKYQWFLNTKTHKWKTESQNGYTYV